MLTDIRKFLDRLLDEEDWDTVELVNDRGESAFFEQVCLIPESDSVMYAILQPVDENGSELGDEIVFSFTDADTDDVEIDVVTDQYVIRDVYTEYKNLRASEEISGEEFDEDYDDYDEEEGSEDRD